MGHNQKEAYPPTSLKINEEKFGPEDPKTANLLNNLALLHFNQDNYAKAEPLMQRALAINEKALGKEHPTVARTLKNYAALLRQTKRATQADEFDARVKAIQEKQEKS